MASGDRLARSPFFFLARRRYREVEMSAYLRREHRRGRHLKDILDDPYIQRCGGQSVLREVLEEPRTIRMLGRDIADSIERSMLSPQQES